MVHIWPSFYYPRAMEVHGIVRRVALEDPAQALAYKAHLGEDNPPLGIP